MKLYLTLFKQTKSRKYYAVYYLEEGLLNLFWPTEVGLDISAKSAHLINMDYNRDISHNLPLCYYSGKSLGEVVMKIKNGLKVVGREVEIFYLGGFAPSEM